MKRKANVVRTTRKRHYMVLYKQHYYFVNYYPTHYNDWGFKINKYDRCVKIRKSIVSKVMAH